MSTLKSIFTISIPEKRIFGLDVIRASAILIVIYQHGASVLPTWSHRYYSLIKTDGVTIFFVLSGFLIGKIIIEILEHQRISFHALLYFWCRRWFRTLPVYYITLSGAAILYPVLRPDIPVNQLAEYFVFLQNFDQPHPKFNGIAWSLSVEEWFYVIVPTLLFGLVALKYFTTKRTILLVCIGVLFFSLAFRHYRYYQLAVDNHEAWATLFRMQVITRMDSIVIGTVGAYILNYFPTFWYKYKSYALWPGLIILLVTSILKAGQFYPSSSYYACVLSFQVEAMATLAMIPFLYSLRGKRYHFYRIITLISLVSYSAYLLHNTIVLELIIHRIDWYQLIPIENLNIFVKYVAYLCVTFLMSVFFYKYLELPLMQIRDSKWIKSRLTPLKDDQKTETAPTN